MMRDLPPKIDRGLGPLVGQLHEPAAAPAGEHIGHGVTDMGPGGGRSRFVLPWLYSPSSWNMTVASGGIVTSAEAGNPCEGESRAVTWPRLPCPEPP